MQPEVVSHNMETVQINSWSAYSSEIWPKLRSFKIPKRKGINRTKSGIGLGEEEEEVFQTMRDLRDVNVDVVTIGQYPTSKTFTG
jgi:lipoic acid synthetase